ncbi:MAG: NAD(P)H-dependent glycerol-3-phosphate dehydrogenase [Sulfitobacter sp.]
MSISILGSGAFGTALGISLCQNGPVTLWARDAGQALKIDKARENKLRLPGCPLPDNLSVTSDLSVASASETVLLAIPLQKLRSFLSDAGADLHDKTLVACCKGIELSTGMGPVSIIQDVLPNASAAILTGPSFAADIARGLPTALTLACADDSLCRSVQHRLSTRNIRLYRTTDTKGAELGGALKNVIAIACGTVIGAGLGESARAALMTRGYAEMQRLAAFLGADATTLAGLSGFGDLTLTCTSEMSRNYRMGLALGSGEEFDASTTVEGVATSRAVYDISTKNGFDMPITAVVAGLLEDRLSVKDAIDGLLSRPLKEE